MDLIEAFEKYKQSKIPSLSEIRENASQHSKTSLFIVIILVALLLLALQFIPHLQVAQFNITNPKDLADAENSYRATLAQILGGVAIAIGLYYTWRRISIAEEDLKATKEGQITERFTRAVDQLGAIDQFGNPAIEIRLGGIYALERIANESEKDYWPIMEILTAYVRKNSSVEIIGNGNDKPISMDVQTILTVLGRRKFSSNFGETDLVNLQKTLDLQGTYLREANLFMANLNAANFQKSDLEGAHLEGIHLKEAELFEANLKGANLLMANLEYAQFVEADLREADLKNANISHAILLGVNLEEALLFEANLKNAHLRDANLEGATLYKANLEGANLRNANLTEASFE